MLVTIFTPTYNRIHTLPRLFDSLLGQTYKNFEWVVVDDGSTDYSYRMLERFKKIADFPVTIKRVGNGGKMRAVNEGVKLAKGEYFMILDSDDYLDLKAVETIADVSTRLPKHFGGMVFRKVDIALNAIAGAPLPSKKYDSNPIEVFYKLGIGGDKAEVIKTCIMKRYPFPEFDEEKFVPEGYVWNSIGLKYKLRYVDTGIYYFEYLNDGYTENFKKLMKRNPKGFQLYYKFMLDQEIPFKQKVKFFIRYWQATFYRRIG
ncbi:MAG: glycosyltransferase family 2 protein [Cetobacterium sp.]|uniref:glycosyltransferase family A protein n=1 Tax=unclassified Cetobacterium TaxID=2630983 RepID=UPI00163D280F|nr:glycosyltransferase family 2 protein [Cetobacterium sp. 2A]MBC2856145.1 glycosyltransferase family 2 protein [Cetobacterium sp. 2A]